MSTLNRFIIEKGRGGGTPAQGEDASDYPTHIEGFRELMSHHNRMKDYHHHLWKLHNRIAHTATNEKESRGHAAIAAHHLNEMIHHTDVLSNLNEGITQPHPYGSGSRR